MTEDEIANTIKDIKSIIDKNTKLVEKGSADSLQNKYFYITKKMENYISEFVDDQKKHLLSQFTAHTSSAPSIAIVDSFAGSGIFTLIFVHKLLQLCLDKRIEIGELTIFLNDILYQSGNEKYIDSDKLKKNFVEIKHNLQYPLINLKEYNLAHLSTKAITTIKKDLSQFNIKFLIANPMITSIKKGQEHLLPISFRSEQAMLKNLSIKKLYLKLLSQFNFFIYITNQVNYDADIVYFNKKYIYRNDYTDYQLSEIDKKRYELLKNQIESYEDMRSENFWKFTSNQKENYNTLAFYAKDNNQRESAVFDYVYNTILHARDARKTKNRLKKIKNALNNISTENLTSEYNNYKDLL